MRAPSFVLRIPYLRVFSSAGAVCEQKMMVGSCDLAAKLATTQNGCFKPRADVTSDLKGLFGEGMADWKMTEVADALHARSCHNMTLPCSDKVIYVNFFCPHLPHPMYILSMYQVPGIIFALPLLYLSRCLPLVPQIKHCVT